MVPTSSFETLVDGLDHPEGVTWGPDGFVYAGGEAGQIYRVSLDGRAEQVASTHGFVLGLCLDGDANIYACDSGHRAIMRVTPSGQVSEYFAGNDEKELITPNYAAFGPRGDLYFSDSGDYGKDNGCLWVVGPEGRGEVWPEEVRAFPNGVALGPDGRSLYVVVSTLPGVVRLSLDGGPAETVVAFDRKVPDGIAFDTAGCMYVSCYTPDEIFKLTPDGQVELFAQDWQRTMLASPTNIAFCGPDLDMLVVANLGRWHLASTRVIVKGLPYHYPKLPDFDR